MAVLNPKAVEAKLREFNGNMAAVARTFGVTRQAVFRHVQKRPQLLAAVNDCREARVDVAESALDRAVDNGEGWAIALVLKTIGKGRGYVERTETHHSGGVALEIVEELADDPHPPETNGQAARSTNGLPPR